MVTCRKENCKHLIRSKVSAKKNSVKSLKRFFQITL